MKKSMQKLFYKHKHPSDELVENTLKHAIRTEAPEKFLDINDLQDGWDLFWYHAYSEVSLKSDALIYLLTVSFDLYFFYIQ